MTIAHTNVLGTSYFLSSKARRKSRSGSTSFVLKQNDNVEAIVVKSAAELGAWIPIGSAFALRGLTPLKLEIFGRNFVVWDSYQQENSSGRWGRSNKLKHDKTTQWSVLEDACPHRLAPLSQSRIDRSTGCIERAAARAE